MDDALLKIDKMCHAIGFEPTETRKNQRVHEDIDTTCGYLLEDKQEIERLEKALDVACTKLEGLCTVIEILTNKAIDHDKKYWKERLMEDD
ncbi:MAG: hypothetical protein ACLUJI_00560 [Faecalibacillus faecis]|uniref:hypothetical protein n=1 Tax=Faecalibacillus faecis TaxID=1982628 RepID=UPI00399553CF